MRIGDIVRITKSDDLSYVSTYYDYGDLAIIISKFLNSEYFDVYIIRTQKVTYFHRAYLEVLNERKNRKIQNR